MTHIKWRHIRWLLLAALAAAALYLIVPQCLSQRVILVNGRDTAVDNLTLWLKPNQQSEKLLWHGSLPPHASVYLGFDQAYGTYTQRLASTNANIDIEFGYFTFSSRTMVVIEPDQARAFFWDDSHPPCRTGDSINCLISLLVDPIRSHVCRPW